MENNDFYQEKNVSTTITKKKIKKKVYNTREVLYFLFHMQENHL